MYDIHEQEVIPHFDLEEKSKYHVVTQVTNSSELEKMIKALLSGKNYMRGMSDVNYKIFSSYHRSLITNQYNYSEETTLDRSKMLNYQLEKIGEDPKFKRALEEQISNGGYKDKKGYVNTNAYYRFFFSIMSRFQHYNSLSFLVDFTMDPYVALFFATYKSTQDKDVCIVSFPFDKISFLDLDLESNNFKLNFRYEEKDFAQSAFSLDSIKQTLKEFNDSSILGRVFSIDFENHYIENTRQNAQKGCFIYYYPNGKVENNICCLDELLLSNFSNPANSERRKFQRFEINKKLIPEITNILQKRGITERTLCLRENSYD